VQGQGSYMVGVIYAHNRSSEQSNNPQQTTRQDVMHDALRPILPTLGNFKSLSLQMLQGLGR